MKNLKIKKTFFLFTLAGCTISCRKENDNTVTNDNFKTVSILDQDYQIELKGWDSKAQPCNISGISVIFDEESNSCTKVTVNQQPNPSSTNENGAIWTLNYEANGKSLLLDQSESFLWVTQQEERLWCFRYNGLLKKGGQEKDMNIVFFSKGPVGLTTDLTAAEVRYVASLDSDEECDIFRK